MCFTFCFAEAKLFIFQSNVPRFCLLRRNTRKSFFKMVFHHKSFTMYHVLAFGTIFFLGLIQASFFGHVFSILFNPQAPVRFRLCCLVQYSTHILIRISYKIGKLGSLLITFSVRCFLSFRNSWNVK